MLIKKRRLHETLLEINTFLTFRGIFSFWCLEFASETPINAKVASSFDIWLF